MFANLFLVPENCLFPSHKKGNEMLYLLGLLYQYPLAMLRLCWTPGACYKQSYPKCQGCCGYVQTASDPSEAHCHRVPVMGSSPDCPVSPLAVGSSLSLRQIRIPSPTRALVHILTWCPVLSSCAELVTGDTWGEEGLWLPLSFWAIPTMGYDRYHPPLNADWAVDLSWHRPEESPTTEALALW